MSRRRRLAPEHPAARLKIGLPLLCVLGALLNGCGTELDGYLSDIALFPDADSISLDVREACAGVLAEQQMLTSLIAARIDQANGYTKEEELASAAVNCALDELVGGAPADDCTACKNAILDQVYGY